VSAVENFFCIQTNPQREAFVFERLTAFEPYFPRFKNLRGRVAPLFPGYLFTPRVMHWGSICSTVGVRGVLMSGDHPALIPAKVISHWKAKERGGLVQLPPPPRFAPGQKLTILRGSLKWREVIHAGMVGRDRERVLIEMLGQQVSLIVSSTDLASDFRPPTRNRLRVGRETFKGQRQHALDTRMAACS
jgi:transcription antitermination factor NusG